ncbi:hypothetical protein P3S67_023142 [Capsicum chacoense]
MKQAKTRDSITRKKQEAISCILASAMNQVKESRKKRNEVNVITIEDSDDESKTI